MRRLIVNLIMITGIAVAATGCVEDDFMSGEITPVAHKPIIDDDLEDVLTVMTDEEFLVFCQSQIEKWDTDFDGALSPDEAALVERIYIPAENEVKSLPGIEYFSGLTYLSCTGNKLQTLDLSYNKKLTTVECRMNELVDIKLPATSTLTRVNCELNQLTSFDVSGCSGLRDLYCGGNQLTALDVTGCEMLATLDCWGNLIERLDLSNMRNLTVVVCQVNEMTSLELNGCIRLRELSANCCLLEGVDVSDSRDLWLCDVETNPGDANGVFTVRAWFDDDERPSGKIPGSTYNYFFPTDWYDWNNERTVTVDYVPVE